MTLFHARDLTISLKNTSGYSKIGAALPSVAFATGAIEVFAKDFKVTEGEKPFDQQNYTGEDANGYQNQGKVWKPIGKNSIEITVDEDGLTALKALLYDKVDSTTISGYTRLQNGNAARKNVDILAVLDDGVDVAQIILLAAEQVAPEINLTGVDGQFEYKIKLEALARDTDVVFKN